MFPLFQIGAENFFYESDGIRFSLMCHNSASHSQYSLYLSWKALKTVKVDCFQNLLFVKEWNFPANLNVYRCRISDLTRRIFCSFSALIQKIEQRIENYC